MGQIIDIAEARRKRDEKLAEEQAAADATGLTQESLETAIAKLRRWAEEIETGRLSIQIEEVEGDASDESDE
jgi:hypothetical protein